MDVRVIRSHYLDGRKVPVGEVLTLGDTLARELIATGKLVEHTVPPEDKPNTKATPKTSVASKKHSEAKS